MTEKADPERTPVIVGVGQLNDRPDNPADGLDPIGLMTEALKLADADAGGALIADCDSLAVVSQIGWPQLSPVHHAVAERLRIEPAHCEQTEKPNGDSPTRLLHEAANRIGRGEARICAVTGGEALRTAARLAALKSDGTKPNALRDASHRVRKGSAQSYGLVVPTDVYPLYENAMRATYGQTLAEGQAESGALWAGMSEVAAHSDGAWIKTPVTAHDVVNPTETNRPIAFPYTKLQVANASVNQGAGFIVTSLAEAHRRGIPDERLVHIGYGAAASEPENFLERADYTSSPSLETVLSEVLALNSVSSADLDLVELYSCFPCVPKMARRVLEWPFDRPITVHGGLTFGGGPIGNYMSHAVVEMVHRLRGSAKKGLLFANGGYATHNHAIVLSGFPLEATFPQSFDYQRQADQRRGEIPPLDRDYEGPARIETYTVFYAQDGLPKGGVVIALTPDGARTLGRVAAADGPMLDLLTGGEQEPVGRKGLLNRSKEGMAIWHSA